MQPAKPEDLIQGGLLDGMCIVCTGLIRLCSNLNFFSGDFEIRRLLIDRLHCIADDHDHAKAMIDRWLETSPAAPKVFDFMYMAQVTRKREALGSGCDVCHGEPWVLGPNDIVRCGCTYGQALAELDRDRLGRRREGAPLPLVN